LLTNFLGGAIAGVLVILLLLREGIDSWKISSPVAGFIALSGFLGILIITGISFSFQRTGIAAGLAALILGQLVISIIVDTYGIGGVDPIPLTSQRVFGLFVMGVAVYLMLPRG
jgi:transporter family-2 protein